MVKILKVYQFNSYYFCLVRHLERARIALDIESGISSYKRKSTRNKYWVDVKGERYLQVEVVEDDLARFKDD